jgi:pimeloyl-ACP methyl ester carboxylesterase
MGLTVFLAIACPLCESAVGAEPPTEDLSGARKNVSRLVSGFERTLAEMRAGKSPRSAPHRDLSADVEVFIKGARWGLQSDSDGRPTELSLIERAVARAVERMPALYLSDPPPWAAKRGRLVRGYVSYVDGSVQPYGLVIPRNYDAARPIRLDVVLHGSTRPQGASELKFMERFDDGDADSQQLADQPYIELHPLGRVENCYRWAGETDVFEAIDDVCRKYKIDRDRIVLRGMSMGASGTWHLGLKHPDQFVALGPYCGYVDTHRFSETPLDTFVRVGALPEHQELALHMLDSVDYAANAGVVSAIACMGENDVFFQAHVIMQEAMEREGLTMVNLISPGTGHVIDPVTHAEQMRRIAGFAERGIDRLPRKLRFITWTLKYSRCHWLELLGLREHYRRSEISAQILDDGTVEVDEPRNVTRFAVLPAALPGKNARVRIANADIPIPDNREEGQPRGAAVFQRQADVWRLATSSGKERVSRKCPGLTGPIDDAFTTKFLCVRGTGRAWNARAQAYCEASLQRFAREWQRYFRGELPVKDDSAVTEDDIRSCNLILFGDPGSNSWIAKLLPKLPIQWTEKELIAAGQRYPSADHVPALIYPNPLARELGADRYVVINSGHTFREAELAKLNYLLFPRWGDWAVLKFGDRVPPRLSDPPDETVVRAGFFDETWQFPGEPSRAPSEAP